MQIKTAATHIIKTPGLIAFHVAVLLALAETQANLFR